MGTVIPAFGWLWEKVRQVFDFIWSKAVWLWQTILYPIFSAIRSFIFNTLLPAFYRLRDGIGAAWDWISSKISGAWTFIRDSILTPAKNWVTGPLLDGFRAARDGIVGAFTYIRDVMGGIWDSITGFIRRGVNAGIGIVNGLIGGLNTVLGLLPGLDFTIGTISPIGARAGGTDPRRTSRPGRIGGRESGGYVDWMPPVGAGFQTNGPMAVVGEGRPQYPEYVIPTDPAHRKNALGLFERLGGQLLAGGGILGGIGDAFSAGAGWVGDRLGDIGDAVFRTALTAAMSGPNAAVKAGLSRLKPGPLHTVDMMDAARAIVWQWVRGADSGLPEKPAPTTASSAGGPAGSLGLVGNALAALPAIRAVAPGTIGGRAPRANRSDHPIGLAMDVMLTAEAAAQRVIAAFKGTAGAKYWIWNRQIASAPGFSPRRYSGPNPHTDHVHLSWYERGGIVPADGPAMLHKGEMVLPRNLSDDIQRSTSGPLIGQLVIQVTSGDEAAGQRAGRAAAKGFEDALMERRIMVDARIR